MSSELLEGKFKDAAEQVKTLSCEPNDETKLKLYSLYKQATVGDNNTDKPGFLDFKGQAKWRAWMSVKGKSKSDAMQEYIKLVDELLAKQQKQ